MGCRVGITTDLERRKREWEGECHSMRSWKKLDTYDTRSEAEEAEKEYAKEHGCVRSPGGREPDNPTKKWHLYRFDF